MVRGQDRRIARALDYSRNAGTEVTVNLDELDAAVQMHVVVPVNNDSTQEVASSIDSNGLVGYCGQYFSVLKIDSENGLSLITAGLENDGTTPSFCIVTSIVALFIGPPLLE